MKKIFLSVLLCAVFLMSQIAAASEFRFSPRSNRAHLIQWRHWSSETFMEARQQDKPILLSLSAVWCHWCHVMDETTYSDSEIISYINEHFIPVRVDSDMRPDIDQLYNQGGWPSTVILTPGGDILEGGTYVPPERMNALLSRVITVFKDEGKDVELAISQIREKSEKARESDTTAPDRRDMDSVTKTIKESYDKKHGGYGMWQKFPNPDSIDFALSTYSKTDDPQLKTIVNTTLRKMHGGEIFDSVEGGFFRYATRADWSAPHYEKMLEGNAGIIRNYADAYRVFGDRTYAVVLKKSIRYIRTNLLDPKTGGFYGSQDADEEYYSEKKRGGLKPPPIDRTIYADSSSLMISALTSAYTATGEEEYLAIVLRAGEFILLNLYDEKEGVFHYFSKGKRFLSGILADNALFGMALLDLYSVTGEKKYREVAEKTGAFLRSTFYDESGNRFRSSLDTTLVRPVVKSSLHDFSLALTNYRTAIFLSRIYYIHKERDENLRSLIMATLTSFRDTHRKFAPSAAAYGMALRWVLEDPVEVIIVAERKKAVEFLNSLNSLYIPEKVVTLLTPAEDKEVIKKYRYHIKNAAYICVGKKCLLPVTNPKDIKQAIRGLSEENV